MRYFVFADYDRTKNDAYAYWKIFILNLWMNCLFMLLFLLSFWKHVDINLGIFAITYRPDAAVDELVYGYPEKVFPVLMVATVIYAVCLFAFRTDFFAKERIAKEHVPVGRFEPATLYKRRPIAFLLPTLFLFFSGYRLWGGPWYLREYELYNYAHDFHAHTFDNFLIFASFYFLFYQTVFAQCIAIDAVHCARSILRHHVYKTHIEEN